MVDMCTRISALKVKFNNLFNVNKRIIIQIEHGKKLHV